MKKTKRGRFMKHRVYSVDLHRIRT